MEGGRIEAGRRKGRGWKKDGYRLERAAAYN